MKKIKTVKKYGIFVINNSRYYNTGAGKLEIIDGYRAIHDTEEDAIEYISHDSDMWVGLGTFVVHPVYIREVNKDWQDRENRRNSLLYSLSSNTKCTENKQNKEASGAPRTFSISNHGVSITGIDKK